MSWAQLAKRIQQPQQAYRLCIAMVAVTIGGAANAQPAEGDNAREAAVGPAATQLDQWLTTLDSPVFADRQRATEALLAAGESATPYLARAVHGASLEAADRAVWILEQHAERSEPPMRLASLELLVGAERFPQAAKRADSLLAGLRLSMCQESLENLGAVITVTPHARVGGALGTLVEVDTNREEWQGTADDLRVLGSLRNVASMKLRTPELADSHFNAIIESEALVYLELFQTQVTFERIDESRKSRSTIQIIVRGRSMLGAEFSTAGMLSTRRVVPGGPAHKAGMESGDILQEFAGVRVANFEELTSQIARFDPGETVEILVERDKEKVPVKVVLGEANWQEASTIKPPNR